MKRKQTPAVIAVDGTQGMTHHVLDPSLRGTTFHGTPEVLTFHAADSEGNVLKGSKTHLKTLCGGSKDRATVIGLPENFDLCDQLRTAEEIRLATAFARESGWKVIEAAIKESKAKVDIITGLYCCHTQPSLLEQWLKLQTGNPQQFRFALAVSRDSQSSEKAVFHPKVLIVCGRAGRFAIVGSGNLTGGGFRSNIECSTYLSDPACIEELLGWFRGIEADDLDQESIEKYKPHYEESQYARKALEQAQVAAEKFIHQKVAFRERAKAIAEAKTFFQSSEFFDEKQERSDEVATIRTLLDYYTFNFNNEGWTKFYKTATLGKIREAHPLAQDDLDKLRDGLRYVFNNGRIEDRLAELWEDNGQYRVHGVGPNIIGKFLVAHDPKQWFVFNKKVRTTLENFGYETGKRVNVRSYLVFVKAMRDFMDDCGAEDAVALDAFFSHWYDTHTNAD